MKKVYFLIIISLSLCCSSCVDMVEQYTFKANGACTVSYRFDMSRAVSVLMNLMSDSLTNTPQFSIKKDTSMNFYSALPDSAQARMTAEEAAMAKSSNLSILMNLKRSQMKVSIDHEAKSPEELEGYLQRLSKMAGNQQISASQKADKTFKSVDVQQLIAGQDCYSYQITPNKFYRIIDLKKFNAFLKKTQSTFAMARAMLIDMPYKVVLRFAKPVKKINNPKAVLSADRRQVTLQTNMDDVMKNPTLMNLKIDF
ncbi:hypothetical protein KHS38_02920 [Mucilaginibacter sp. Bleaf8]|uniref:hypothetical protein n=1 Tax=Mucilaginibacter sp. Bleaf8 TaxID=2834430 RepID=UPI001BCFB2F4|nr:hypothetical protein [Mucilaginibacter sp. Bleaf8]MBS7563344.1 hypothetical protein [Mucilaginibacter sp. Bleaf8]